MRDTRKRARPTMERNAMRVIGVLSTKTGHQNSRWPAQHSIEVISTIGGGIVNITCALGRAVLYLLVVLRFVSRTASTGRS